MTKPDLITFPAETLAEGMQQLVGRDDNVVPLRAKVPGKHQYDINYKDDEEDLGSAARCTAPGFDDVHPMTFENGVARYNCPSCHTALYARTFAKHRADVTA